MKERKILHQTTVTKLRAMAITLRVRTAISHHQSPCFALIRAHRQGMAVKPLNHQKAVLRCLLRETTKEFGNVCLLADFGLSDKIKPEHAD